MLYLGLILLIAGYILKYKINEKAFRRRNAFGIEEFSSYGEATAIRFMEGSGKMIAKFMIIVGVILLVISFLSLSPTQVRNQSEGHVQTHKR